MLGLIKQVRVRISKELHKLFRLRCIERGLSMQRVLKEFIEKFCYDGNKE